MLRVLARHTYWNAIATFGYQGSTFLANFLVIKLLDQVSYGKYSLVSITALHVANVLQFGVGSTVAKYCSRYMTLNPARVPAVIATCALYVLLSSAVGCTLLVLASGQIAEVGFLDASLGRDIAIVALSIPGLIGSIFLNGLLQGLIKFRPLAISAVVSGVLFVLAVAYGAYCGGLLGAVAGFVTGSIARSLILGVAAVVVLVEVLPGRFSRSTLFDGSILREIVHFQVPAGLASCLTIPSLWLMPTILAHTTQDYSEVASYSVILLLKSLIVLPASVVTLALQPAAEAAWSKSDRLAASRVFMTGMYVSLASVGGLALLLVIVAGPLLQFLGHDFVRAERLLQWMMLAAVAEAGAVSFLMRIQAVGRMWTAILATLVPRDLLMLSIAVAFTSTYGLRAIIFAHVIGAIANLIGTCWLGIRSTSVTR